ncbi:MAG: hypothetical protein ACJ72H_18110 [Candidatus Sulfotelmatobacter sp.]
MAVVNIRRTNLTGELRRIRQITKDPLDKQYLTLVLKSLKVLTVETSSPDVAELERMYLLQDTRD